jgi:type II secretory pathway pseudopilin PulG
LILKNSGKKAGFTLVEVLLSAVISVLVFGAMGVLLTRSFTLWMDAMAHWQLAQHAQVARVRLLDGGFGAGSGLLNATRSNLTLSAASGENYVQYYPLTTNAIFRAYGWAAQDYSSARNIRLRDGGSVFVVGQNVASSSYQTNIGVSSFIVNPVSNKVLRINYELYCQVMGKTFTRPCTVRAYIGND